MATTDSKSEEFRVEPVEVVDTSQHREKTASEQIQIPSPVAVKVKLSWKTWVVVFISCFSITTQVFVVAAATSVIAFIVRDIGDAPNSTWIIQGPLLMQSVLSPIVGRLSDVLDRKWMVSIPPIIAAAGAVVCALSKDMSMLIGGGILIGTTLACISIVQSIPSEVLPMKYRPLANGMAFVGGAVGSLVGKLGAGAVTNISASGWRYIFWMQVAFHLTTALGFLVFYWPQRRSDYPRMTMRQMFWAIDPIGSGLFIVSTTLMLLSLNWGGSRYPWASGQVVAPLTVGCVVLVLFCVYVEWKGRNDGIIAHVFFKGGPNFSLAIFAFAVEGWVYYSAVNAITPQLVLNLGFENNSWDIAVRQMSYQVPILVTSIPITWYATRYKDLKWPLVVTFTLFLIVTILYANIRPSWANVQYVFNVLCGIGQSGPLTLIVATVQFTAPHAFLSTATGLAFTSRAIGGAFGAAVLNSIINGYLTSHYARDVGGAAIDAGLPSSSVPDLITGIRSGNKTLLNSIEGLTDPILAEAVSAGHWTYAHAYRLAWSSIIPFTVLAIVAVAFLKDVKKLMTDRIEATVEKMDKIQEAKNVNNEV
ncbi:uncharacterized protein Z519_00948 [Cladophialophora bantiana CBS 173.52]|uniref:Major facilitator superfamily (MFS) profile domain-containing protein n=1 Tax=Cladophialophora bantiana (strain ATCC 10958 / CBS 173.52 / CDC B-1940 / NIH 8579) TaxID=1442370 RepID=A0A0D2I7R2_CLAB1|nr:uncharacterized protein Z519_00948 [Cladophialophora bantiana CBS 173.52]KIW99285.1 hypothetical protein Z519_00948 [Cladophialophora bantiana CBS 173.52]